MTSSKRGEGVKTVFEVMKQALFIANDLEKEELTGKREIEAFNSRFVIKERNGNGHVSRKTTKNGKRNTGRVW